MTEPRPIACLDSSTLAALQEHARQNRLDVTRMFLAAGNGHFGSCFSCTEIVTALYFHVLRIDPADPQAAWRDRFVMSKGHAAPTLYSALIRRGFMPEAWMDQFECVVGARLMTHPSRRYQPGCDISTGALGHGLSVGAGMALAGAMDQQSWRTFVLLGDGELHEGAVWEAAAAAAKYRLHNLVAIVDANGLCVDGPVHEVLPIEPLEDRWRAFGWAVRTIDGHSFEQLIAALTGERTEGRPVAVIARTVKGRGVPFMEHARGWHADAISAEQGQLVREALARSVA